MDTLLVPIDLSRCSHVVVARAAELAARLGATLRLLHVVSPPPGAAEVHLPEGGTGEGLLLEEARRMTEPYAVLARELGVPAEVVIVEADKPHEAILEAAGAEDVGMIVMGTHGRTGLTRLLLGSVAEQVIRRADVPVVTIRSQWHETCEPSSCAVCDSHVTPGMRRVQAELEG